MDINTSQTYASELYAQKSQAAGANVDEDQKSNTYASSTASVSRDKSTTNGVTGTTGSRLSAETTAALLESSQQASTTAPETERTVFDMTKDVLDELINDPTKAKEYVERFKNVMIFPGNGLQLPTNGSSAEVWQKFKIKQDLHISSLNNLAQERSNLIDTLKIQGKSDLEIIVQMFDFEANAPSRFGPDAIGYAQSQSAFNNKSYAQFSGEMRDYLSQQIKESSHGSRLS